MAISLHYLRKIGMCLMSVFGVRWLTLRPIRARVTTETDSVCTRTAAIMSKKKFKLSITWSSKSLSIVAMKD